MKTCSHSPGSNRDRMRERLTSRRRGGGSQFGPRSDWISGADISIWPTPITWRVRTWPVARLYGCADPRSASVGRNSPQLCPPGCGKGYCNERHRFTRSHWNRSLTRIVGTIRKQSEELASDDFKEPMMRAWHLMPRYKRSIPHWRARIQLGLSRARRNPTSR
jgi:hypothetical protein